MFTEYRKLKQLGKANINLDGVQPELYRDLHDINTGEILLEPRIDVIDTNYLDIARAELLDKIKDIDELRVDVANAIEVKTQGLKDPQELP